MAKIVIVGAGVGGLATANLLAQDGHEVHIYEKNDQLGGRTGRLEKDGFTFDTGPSWYLMPGVFDRYYKSLGTTAQKELDLIKLSPTYKVYSGNEHLTLTGDIDKDAATFENVEPQAGDALRKYVKKSTRTYDLALKHFLYNNFETPAAFFNPEVLRNAFTMLYLAKTPIHSYVQRSFKTTRLQQILEYTMVFLGSSPYSAPALYSLMSALDFNEGVYYPRGTMYAVVESFVKIGRSLGVSYHLNTPVKSIVTAGSKTSGIELEDGTIISADIVISNADLHFTETKLLAPDAQSYPERYWKKREASPSALLIYMGIEGTVPEFEHHTLLFTEDWRANFEAIFDTREIPKPASIYISKTSQTDATAPEGKENIFVLVPLPSGISLSDEEQELLADEYLEQVKATTGVDLKSRTISRTLFGPNQFASKYNAWESTMLGPSHKLFQSAIFRTPNKSKKVKNLFYVGASTVPGIGVPMCLISAELVRERIAKFSGKEPQ